MSPRTQTSWVPSTRTLGARLALVRQHMGWNVKEAAEACGLKESNWRGWEMDGRMPHKLNEIASKISLKTGVNKYWLLDGESPVVLTTGPKLPDQDSNLEPAGSLRAPETRAKEWQKRITLAHNSIRGMSGRSYPRGTTTPYKTQN